MFKTYILLCTINCVLLWNEILLYFPIPINRIQTSKGRFYCLKVLYLILKKKEASIYRHSTNILALEMYSCLYMIVPECRILNSWSINFCAFVNIAKFVGRKCCTGFLTRFEFLIVFSINIPVFWNWRKLRPLKHQKLVTNRPGDVSRKTGIIIACLFPHCFFLLQIRIWILCKSALPVGDILDCSTNLCQICGIKCDQDSQAVLELWNITAHKFPRFNY